MNYLPASPIALLTRSKASIASFTISRPNHRARSSGSEGQRSEAGDQWSDVLGFDSFRSQFQSVSVSVALLFAVFGSVTPLGAVTVAVSEIEPVAEALIVPVAL